MLVDSASIDWTTVIVAGCTLAGVVFTAVVNALVALKLRRVDSAVQHVASAIETPSTTPIGKQVEGAHTIAISNRHELAGQSKKLATIEHAIEEVRANGNGGEHE